MNEWRRPRFPWWAYGLVLVLILLFAFAPIISIMVSGAIAEANGCTLNEADVHPCIVNGTDLGPTLSVMFVLGWLALATLPLGAGGVLVWLITLIIHRIAWGRMQKKKVE